MFATIDWNVPLSVYIEKNLGRRKKQQNKIKSLINSRAFGQVLTSIGLELKWAMTIERKRTLQNHLKGKPKGFCLWITILAFKSDPKAQSQMRSFLRT